MTLNVNLEDVPWAILEAVRGRIMSNRRRLQESQDQQQQRPALQPKPQFRKFGADGRTWKRPEPAATPYLDKALEITGCQINFNPSQGFIEIRARNASAPTRFELYEQEDNGFPELSEGFVGEWEGSNYQEDGDQTFLAKYVSGGIGGSIAEGGGYVVLPYLANLFIVSAVVWRQERALFVEYVQETLQTRGPSLRGPSGNFINPLRTNSSGTWNNSLTFQTKDRDIQPIFKSFVVTDNGAFEISTPQEVESLLKVWHPKDVELIPNTVRLRPQGPSGEIDYLGILGNHVFYGGTYSTTWSFNSILQLPIATDTGALEFIPVDYDGSYLQSQGVPYIPNGYLKAYGGSRFAMLPTNWTPSIYALASTPRNVLDQLGSAPAFNTDAYFDYYNSADNAKPGLESKPLAYLEPIDSDRVKTGFIKSATEYSSATAPSVQNVGDALIPDFARSHIIWNWNDRQYCRQQLAQLGFSAADLTP
jgi:hypothetical protein